MFYQLLRKNIIGKDNNYDDNDNIQLMDSNENNCTKELNNNNDIQHKNNHYNTLEQNGVINRWEWQGRGSGHVHGCCTLKNDSGLISLYDKVYIGR